MLNVHFKYKFYLSVLRKLGKAKIPSNTLCPGLVACCVTLGMECDHCLANLSHGDLSPDAKTSSILKQRETFWGEWPSYLIQLKVVLACTHTHTHKRIGYNGTSSVTLKISPPL